MARLSEAVRVYSIALYPLFSAHIVRDLERLLRADSCLEKCLYSFSSLWLRISLDLIDWIGIIVEVIKTFLCL